MALLSLKDCNLGNTLILNKRDSALHRVRTTPAGKRTLVFVRQVDRLITEGSVLAKPLLQAQDTFARGENG